jgi:hypothetical protein
MVGSSLTDEPIAERIVCIPLRGPALALPLLEALTETMRSCAWEVDATAAQARAATALRMNILLRRQKLGCTRWRIPSEEMSGGFV